MSLPRNTTTKSAVPSSEPGYAYINLDHLDLIERVNRSLRAEEAAGTPVDPGLIDQSEKWVKEVRDRVSGLSGSRK